MDKTTKIIKCQCKKDSAADDIGMISSNRYNFTTKIIRKKVRIIFLTC